MRNGASKSMAGVGGFVWSNPAKYHVTGSETAITRQGRIQQFGYAGTCLNERCWRYCSTNCSTRADPN